MDPMSTDHQSPRPRGLPAHELASAQLAARMEQPGCPVCGHVEDLVARSIEGFLYESINDVTFRAALDEARGFCPAHVREMVAIERSMGGGMLGTSILFDAILRVRLAELDAVHRARGLTRRQRARAAARPPACLICATRVQAVHTTVGILVRQSSDPAWAEVIASADLCLEHLAAAMAVTDRPDAWRDVERRQLERMAALRDLVVAFAYHSAHDRRHLITPEEVASHGAVMRRMTGDPAPQT